jgi:hypothetical protein
MDLISARNASAAMPTIRNGIDKSHTIGHNTSASNAIGQHNTNKIAHNRNMSNTLIVCLLTINLPSYYSVTQRSKPADLDGRKKAQKEKLDTD